jgi:hypothetical protein
VFVELLVAQACVAGQLPPVESGTGEPKLDPSTRNWTEPVGGVLPDAGVTSAVKLTNPPYVDGFEEELTEVDVEIVLAVNVTVTEPVPLVPVTLIVH